MSAGTYSSTSDRGRAVRRSLLVTSMRTSAWTDRRGLGGLLLLAAVVATLGLAGPAHGAAEPGRTTDANYAREQQRYEQGVREAETARLRYEADTVRYRDQLARHSDDVARSGEARADYERRLAARGTAPSPIRARPASASPASAAPAIVSPASASPAPAARRDCQERNRRRGRGVGAVLGGIAGIAGGLGGRFGRAATLTATLVPVGALLGEAIAGLLDCDEQRQAATATEQAVSGGVGTTTTWTSATRPGVTGSSTVTAADGNECLTVTDVVIVDGQETRAPKRMCRRPPNNRFVRV